MLRITPVAGGLKAAQYAAMREMKLSLDQVMHPAASSMMSFGILGTGFQSVPLLLFCVVHLLDRHICLALWSVL